MNVLAIESSGAVGSVAACRDETVLAEETLERGMEHGRMLVSLADRVVRHAGWEPRRDLDLIAVSQGPGSFTGLRVGIICAKTLSVLLNRPIVGVCSLDAMAENAPADRSTVLTVIDAKRGQVYTAAFARDSGALRRVTGPGLMTPAETLKDLAQPVYVMGEGLRQHAPAYPAPRCVHAPVEEWRVRAVTVARLGLAAHRAGRSDEPFGMQPIYLRLAEAEERRLAREGKGA